MSRTAIVVLVEDHEETREMYSDSLAFAGFQVHAASDADDGFALAVRLLPRVVVTDFWLRGSVSGAELCNRLKHDARTMKIPTLLVTASSLRTDAKAALAKGCAIVRLKPYMPDALARDVRSLIAGRTIAAWPSEHDLP